MRVTLLTNMVPPYRRHLLRELGKVCQLSVLVCQDREADRDWPIAEAEAGLFTIRAVPGITFVHRGNNMASKHIRPAAFRMIADQRPEVAIVGDASWTSWLGQVGALAARIPVVAWNERPVWDAPRSPVKRLAMRFLFDSAACHVVCGSAAERFVTTLGGIRRPCFVAPDSVDPAPLDELTPVDRPPCRRLVCVSALLPRKCIDHLLLALARPALAGWSATMVGDGPERERLLALAKALGLGSRVSWTGSVAPTSVGRHITDADLLVLPSASEPWGLVVNEALARGVPVIATRRCAAAIELLSRFGAGLLIEPGDVDGLAAAILHVADDPDRLVHYRLRARCFDQAAERRREAEAFLAACRTAYDRKR